MTIPEFKPKRVFLEDIDVPCLFAKVKNSELPKVATQHIAKHKKDPTCEIWVRGSNPKELTGWPKEMLAQLLEKESLPAALEEGMREYETNKEEWPGYDKDDEENYGQIKEHGIVPLLTVHTIVIDEIRRIVILGCHTEWDIHLGEHGIAIFFKDGNWRFQLGDYLSEYMGDVEEEGSQIRLELARPPGPVTPDSVTDTSFIEGTWAFDTEESLALLKRIKASTREIKETLDISGKFKLIIKPPIVIESVGPSPLQKYEYDWLGCERRGEKVKVSYQRKRAAKAVVDDYLYCNGILINASQGKALKKVPSPESRLDGPMTYAQAIQFLYSLQLFGARPGLETPILLSAKAGVPQSKLRFIHVAGTNGKGSTCAMLESIYRAAGLRVGLFTSPHLVSFRERIQVNRELISEADVARLATEILSLLEKFFEDKHPTMFEVVTVMALRHFAEQKCDLVIWEAGLGGRLDATNIVIPLASVITNIGLDHQAWLGDTLAKIAAEKAGIIKPCVPVVTTERGSEALSVIEKVARDRARLAKVDVESSIINHQPLALMGEHQKANAALAVAVIKVLRKTIPVSDEQIASGLAQVKWPGRLQLITRPGGQRVLLDGAHNVAGVEALVAAVRKDFPTAKRTLILGMLADKDWRPMCELLAPIAERIILVPVESKRTASPEQLAKVFRIANLRAEVLCMENLPRALENAAKDEFVVIAGSLYLIGAALVLLDPEFSGCGDERGLNEWGGVRK